ncbi:FecR family protein [Cytophagaceae bacterium ABcell3]|nr:FecR family protein [Cytophagaceae bacterium ABcell3]
MSNINKGRFKDAFKKKIGEDKPLHSERDEQIWENVLQEISEAKPTTSNKKVLLAVAASLAFLLICSIVFLYQDKTSQTAVTTNEKIENKQKTSGQEEEKVVAQKEQKETSQTSEPKEKAPSATEETPNPPKEKTNVFANASRIYSDNKTIGHKLPDGSMVSLNTGTSLKVADGFSQNRKLLLKGEAYFEVETNTGNPFTVHFDKFQLTVTGTKFNIRSIDGERSKEVTVTEGTVVVRNTNNNDEGIEVSKNEQLKINEQGKYELVKVVSDNYITWKTNNLNFNQARLEEVFLVLSRHYNIKLVPDDNITSCKFTGDLSDLSAQEALNGVCLTSGLKADTLENHIFIKGETCE